MRSQAQVSPTGPLLNNAHTGLRFRRLKHCNHHRRSRTSTTNRLLLKLTSTADSPHVLHFYFCSWDFTWNHSSTYSAWRRCICIDAVPRPHPSLSLLSRLRTPGGNFSQLHGTVHVFDPCARNPDHLRDTYSSDRLSNHKHIQHHPLVPEARSIPRINASR